MTSELRKTLQTAENYSNTFDIFTVTQADLESFNKTVRKSKISWRVKMFEFSSNERQLNFIDFINVLFNFIDKTDLKVPVYNLPLWHWY